jgi:hypothetical protein
VALAPSVGRTQLTKVAELPLQLGSVAGLLAMPTVIDSVIVVAV